MLRQLWVAAALILGSSASAAQAAAAAAASPLPNIVWVFVDDWGHNNVGWHARAQANAHEIQTPTLDALAAAGRVLENAYVFRFCSPSRSAFHTGRHPIHVNVLNSDLAAANATSDPVSGYAGIPLNMTALPAKLRSAGYNTVASGKMHLDLATPVHTPLGRGYQHSLVYLDGANDYYTSETGDWCGAPTVDLWQDAGPALGLNNSLNCSQSWQPPSCVYEDALFTDFALARIAEHDPATPLFLYFAPHSVHLPLEVPDAQLAKFDFITDSTPRRHYSAMVNNVDAYIGRIVAALKAKGMWENTLLAVSADNGGPIFGQAAGCTLCDGSAGANNYPLRGGKHSNFQGGVRANAVVSGGLIPPAVRNTTLHGLISVEDWFRTFCGLAGVDPTDEAAAAAGLPPVEGVNLWPYLSGANSTPPRTEIWLGADSPVGGTQPGGTFLQGLIRADGFKLLTDLLSMNVHTGPLYPNATTAAHPWRNDNLDCGQLPNPTCLFNVFVDETEQEELHASRPDVVAEMAARMTEISRTLFSPWRGNPDPRACKATKELWHGRVGPFIGVNLSTDA